MKKIFSIAGLMCALLAVGMAPAFADQRTSVTVAAPLPVNTLNTSNIGLTFGYALIKAGPVEIAPTVTTTGFQDFGSKFHVAPGIMANISVGKLVLGVGEVLKSNGTLNLNANNYSPTINVGIKL